MENRTPDSTHLGHRGRMKKRFLENRDLSGFSQHEVLEMLLFFCYARSDTNALAHRLINHFGSFDAVMTAEPEELIRSGLVGDSPAWAISFFCSLCAYIRRGCGEQQTDAGNYDLVREYIAGRFEGETRERVRLFPVSDSMKIVRCIPLSDGGRGRVGFNVADIVQKLMPTGCRSLFVAHNHPGAPCTPSAEDRTSTTVLARGLEDFGIHLIDHIIVGCDGVCSMRSLGMMSDF